ncbi:MAG: methyltransferase domain-containing protein [Alphaproteobacteria bacterium]
MRPENLLAEKRLEFALMLMARGDAEGALSLAEETLALAPSWDAAHFARAEALEALGRLVDAAAAFADYLRHAEADVMGAEARLALLGAAPTPTTLPEAYVRTLFDQYADRFEAALLGKLDYQAPYQIAEAVARLRPDAGGGLRVLDLGCGTGLAGEAFRNRASWLAGVDLSPGMIQEARRKRIYDELAEAVAVAALDAGGLFGLSAQRADAADYSLGAEHRFSHSKAYLRRMAADAGLETLLLEDAVCRREAGVDVPSLLGVFAAPGARAKLAAPILAASAPFDRLPDA